MSAPAGSGLGTACAYTHKHMHPPTTTPSTNLLQVLLNVGCHVTGVLKSKAGLYAAGQQRASRGEGARLQRLCLDVLLH